MQAEVLDSMGGQRLKADFLFIQKLDILATCSISL
jgi:hypothetical protein